MARPASEGSDLTHSQTQIWVGQRLNPGSPLYNMAFAFVFPTALHPEVFCEAWRRVVEGSDALRTRVVDRDGGGRRVCPAASTAVRRHRLSPWPQPADLSNQA